MSESITSSVIPSSKPIEVLSQSLAEIAERVGRSLVRIDARRRHGTSGVVWSAEGFILSTHHAIERDEQIGVVLPDGTESEAKLVGRDPTTDLALLKVDAPLVPPTWGRARSLKVGNLVLAVSRPGKSVRARLGVVSVFGEGVDTGFGGRIEPYLETDIGPHPGFSGSALVDVSGQVVGLNTAHLLRGASVAVPFDTLERVVSQLIEHGKIRRGYLGVGLHPVQLPETVAKVAGTASGLLVLTVEPSGPAERAGLALGDTLVSLDGGPVEDLSDLFARLSGDKVGTEFSVRFLRGGQLQTAKLTVGQRP